MGILRRQVGTAPEFLLVSLLAIGCATQPRPIPDSPAAWTPTSGPTSANSPSFRVLTRWQPTAVDPMQGGPRFYLSTDPLAAECATQVDAGAGPVPPVGRTFCDWPLEELPANGLLILVVSTRVLRPMPTAGDPMEIKGETVRMTASRPGRCSEIGADGTISFLLPMPPQAHPRDQSNLAVLACLRGPSLAELESQLREVFRTWPD